MAFEAALAHREEAFNEELRAPLQVAVVEDPAEPLEDRVQPARARRLKHEAARLRQLHGELDGVRRGLLQ